MFRHRRAVLLATAAAAVSTPLAAQPAAVPATVRPAVPVVAGARPFAVGERFGYDVRYGPLRVGKGSIELANVEAVRGRPAWRAVFRLKGGNALYRLDNTFQSWIDTTSLASMRFIKEVKERGRAKSKSFEIYADRGVYAELGKGEFPTVAGPLDDASFFYFVRTVPLEVGQWYEFDRYFKPDRNPVGVRVVRRERVTTPAGTFDAIVIRPVIKTSGLLGESRRTEVWLSDDARRMVLQVRSELPVGAVTMVLREYQAGSGTAR
jgi:Protein of unknown function (DUF3108)